MTAHTPGPWFVDANGKVWRRDPRDLYENGGGVAGDHPIATAHRGWSRWENVFPVEANARLIAAAPDYHDAVQDIFRAVEANAAPINVIAALREVSLQDVRVSLDPDLLIALFEAHAKAKGEQP